MSALVELRAPLDLIGRFNSEDSINARRPARSFASDSGADPGAIREISGNYDNRKGFRREVEQ